MKIKIGNCLDVLKNMSAKSIHTCVTSPPYWGLRDYGTATWVGGDPNCPHYRTSHQSDKTITGHKKSQKSGGIADSIYKKVCPKCGAVRQDRQLGLEETPQEYVDNLVKVFREVKRVLRDDGTLWLNLGDSYSSGGRTSTTNQTVRGDKDYGVTRPAVCKDIKPKDLVGIPWRVAFALQEDGWYLRQDIIWNKPNPMPESVKDRCTKAHEYIFLLSKQPKYYFYNDAIRENLKSKEPKTKKEKKPSILDPIYKNGKKIIFNRPKLPSKKVFVDFLRKRIKLNELVERSNLSKNTVCHWFRYDNSGFSYPTPEDWEIAKEFINDWSEDFYKMDYSLTYIESYNPPQWRSEKKIENNPKGKNKRSVWTVTTKPYKEAHFATYPPDLIEPCILAGCPKGGTVLDPFGGSGTTALVADRLGRDAILIELNKEYAKIAEKRLTGDNSLFANVIVEESHQ